MRFRSINIFSGEQLDGNRKKALTGMFREESDYIVNVYLKSFKYYNNDQCISLNISCDEEIEEMFVEDLWKGYPVLHIPFDLECYRKIAASNKNEFWLKVVHDAVEHVGNEWNWDLMFFEKVYKECIIRLSNDI